MFQLKQSDLVYIHSCFYEPVLKRGWRYYMNDRVSQLEIDGQRVQAVVVGTHKYRVHLDINHIHLSRCTCPYDDYCKHMAAVLFEYLERTGQQPQVLLAPQQTIARVPSRDEKQGETHKAEHEPPEESNSIEEWHRRFDLLVGKVEYRGLNSFEVYVQKTRQTLLPVAADWSPDARVFYHLHVWLYLFQRLDELHQQVTFLYQHHRSLAQQLAGQWVDELSHDADSVHEFSATERYGKYLKETVRFFSHAAFPAQETVNDWALMYRFFWALLPTNESIINQEILRLHAECGHPTSSLERTKLLVAAMLHLEVITAQDAKALETVERHFPLLELNTLFQYLDAMVRQQKWHRLLVWVCWWRPRAGRLQSAFQYRYLGYWRTLAQEGYAKQAEREQVLVELIPSSFYEFSEYLLEQNRCQEWVSLHLWNESDPLEMEKSDLKYVADTDLPLLLPLYHQSAERWIQEKNRTSYKQAVKTLKKLRTHYRKLKQMSRWEAYLEVLSKKYKRYRALQEELQKGKLLP